MSSAQPIMNPVWRGSFNIFNEDVDLVEGLVAHLSSKAALEVPRLASLFPTPISYKFIPSADVWPRIADRSAPIEAEIDLYFLPEKGRYETDYYKLLHKMYTKGLILRTEIGNRELLVFTSTLLALPCQRLERKHYLWGVFMGNEVPNHPCRQDGGGLSSSASGGCEGSSEIVSNPTKETVGVPQRQLSEGTYSNSESSGDSTNDATFLQFLRAFDEQEKSAETDTLTSSPPAMQVGPYTVEAKVAPTLEAIFETYGDIAQSCAITNNSARSRFLEELCRVVKELEGIKFAGSHGRRHLRTLLTAVAHAEDVGLNVAWLRQRHDELSEIYKGIKDFTALQNDIDKAETIAESAKRELESKIAENMKLESRMRDVERQLASLGAEKDVIESRMGRCLRNVNKSYCKSLADRLL